MRALRLLIGSRCPRRLVAPVVRLGVVVLALSAAATAPVEALPTIRHEDVGCLPRDEFTRFLADIEPPDTIRSAKLYFRSELYPDFYFVEMTPGDGAFEAVLPLPSEETTRVVYYIEAVDVAFGTTRSMEHVVNVAAGGCQRGPGGVAFLADPEIVVGALQSGAAALPAGFQATGVVGFVSSAGAVAGAGASGLGLGAALGAAAGGAVGVGVLVAGGNEAPNPSSSSTVPASVALGGASSTTTSVISEGPGGSSSSTTSSSPGGGSSSSTTSSSPGGGPGPGPETTTTTTTVPTTTAPSGPTACFDWQPSGACKVAFDATCSSGGVSAYEWTLLGPPVPPPPAAASFTFDFSSDPRCGTSSTFNRPVRLRVVDAEGRSDTVQRNVSVPQSLGLTATGRDVAVATRLDAPSGELVQGWVSIDGGTPIAVRSGATSLSRARLEGREVQVVATLASPAPPGTLWELGVGRDGATTVAFRVETGNALVVEAARIVFRLDGVAGEQVRFRVSLR